jgi:hypothetical protein
MKHRLFLISVLAAIAIFAGNAQSPAPTVAPLTALESEALPAATKALQEMKTANEELLKKQDAALQRLEELQKAADEIKIFGKRS